MGRGVVTLLVGWVLMSGAATAKGADPLRDEIEQSLRTGILEVWFPRALDREHGGFLCDFDYQWKPSGSQPKTIVFQSRLTWLASQAVTRYSKDPRYRQAADHGFAFLRDKLWDKREGGWYWRLDRAGAIDDWKGVKHAYGAGFGIYACAAYYRATQDPAALQLAKDGFAWLDRVGHDGRSGGYHEYFARNGAVIVDVSSNPLNRDRDAIGTRVGLKSMNTHIHLLEAFTALYEVWPDESVKKRLDEVLAVVRDRIVAPGGAMHQFFNPQWNPVPDLDSFGHDVETAYLLLEAAEVSGGDPGRVPGVAKALLDHALDYGWDDRNGGFFEAGSTFGAVHDKRKSWWVQAEGLNALLRMSLIHQRDPRDYRKLFERQWAYMKKNVIDAEGGEWFQDALDAGGNPKANKASEWKAGYHGGRALMNAVDWLSAGR
jgi:mannobiose 2-epimerase